MASLMVMKKRLLSASLVLAVVGLAGCGAPATFRATATPRTEASSVASPEVASPEVANPVAVSIEASRPASHEDGATGEPIPCVMEVMGTGLRYAERPDGVVMSFGTVDPDAVAELRQAARGLSRAYDGTLGGVRYGRADRGTRLSPAQMGLPPLRARVESTDDGARVVLTSTDELDGTTARDRLVTHARLMRRGVCPLFARQA